MNERIEQTQLSLFMNRIQNQLPKNLSKQETEEIAMYALQRLTEAKKEKIVFNPIDNDNPLSDLTPQKTGKSESHLANIRYKKSNTSKKIY